MKRGIVASIIAALLLSAPPAQATFPGKNGKLAFYSGRDGNFDIYTIESDGSGLTRVTEDPAVDWEPAWNADGTKLALASRRDGNSQIYTMNADGTGVQRVTNHEAEVFSPAWSPDGKKIAFASKADIYTINVDGTGETRVTNSPEYWSVRADEWSPDGTRIAYTVYLPFRYSLPSMNTVKPDGAETYPLVGFGSSATWSPDGASFAFAKPVYAGDIYYLPNDIYRQNLDGSGLAPLTTTEAVSEGAPSWSPNGASIAFVSGTDIYVMNADGAGMRNLTNTPNTFDESPAWQPLPEPQRRDYKNASHYCKALREFLGDDAFRTRFGGGANAHGKCVSANH